jgi:hypothetical protein
MRIAALRRPRAISLARLRHRLLERVDAVRKPYFRGAVDRLQQTTLETHRCFELGDRVFEARHPSLEANYLRRRRGVKGLEHPALEIACPAS